MASSSSVHDARYQPGSWCGIIRQGTVVLLGPDTPPQLVSSLWSLLASGPEAHEVLNHVTEAFGVSLSRIPPFGIIDARDQLRVFLRGDLELTVRSADAREVLSGRDVTTWTERRITSADAYSLRVAASSGGLAWMPVNEGAVLLAGLDVNLAPGPGQGPSAAPVSDETVLGYPDADLGLTIAPHTHPAEEEPEADPVTAAGVHAADVAAGPSRDGEPPASGQETTTDGDDLPAASLEAHTDLEEPGTDSGDLSAGMDETEVPVHTSTTDPNVPTLENTTNYDHLWDKTVMRNIEDAAVRIEGDSEEDDVPAAGPVAIPVDALYPAEGAEAPRGEGDGRAQGASVVVPGHGGTAPEAAAPIGVPALIDSVPWLRSTTGAEAGQSSVAPTPQSAAKLNQPSPVPSSAPQDPDHDGQTIMKSSVAESVPAPSAASPGSKPQPGNGPTVLARVCSQSHANPPTYSQCAVCGQSLTGDAEQVARPRLGRMRLSTGELIDLDQSLIIGRQPSVSRVQGGTMPRLVQVESPGGDISRSHVEVRLEGWHVMLCDLKATNGTVLIREGQAPRRLAQNEMAILLDGDIAELGDDISLRFEEIL